MSNPMDHEEEAAFLLAMQLASASVLQMVLKSAIELDLLHLIKKADSASASASELASHIPTNNNPQAATMVDRILRLLAAYSVVNCSLTTLTDDRVERRYSLAPVCRFLTRNEDGVSLAAIPFSLQDKVFIESWCNS